MMTPTTGSAMVASFPRCSFLFRCGAVMGCRAVAEPVPGIAFAEPVRGATGPPPYRGEIIAQHRHMSDLAPRPDLLAVEVHPGPRIRGEQVVQPLVHAHPARPSTEDIRHHD